MTIKRRFIQCDVFTANPTRGNALAVVVDADGLTDAQFQQFAAWTNLAETTFLLPPSDPSADYKVKIFTPTREMPFAGHPTLGSCAAWLHSGGIPADKNIVKQECGIGIVEIDISGKVPAFIAPPTKIAELPNAETNRISTALGLSPDDIVRTARLDNGPVWQAFWLKNAAAVLAADSSRVRWPEFKSIGLIGPHDANTECDFEVRMFASSSGMSEDPITGSLNSALAHWMADLGQLPQDVVVAQGTSIDRIGRVYISPDKADKRKIRIGGQTHILIEGSVAL